MNRHQLTFTAAVLVGALLAAPLPAQTTDKPPTQPGLVAEYEIEGSSYRRIDDSILFVGHEERLDERLPTGPLRVSWTGQLFARENGSFTFSVFCRGRVRLSIAGQEILTADHPQPAWHHSQPIELAYGRVEFQLEYACPTTAPSLGLYWQGPSFELEPITAKFFSHSVADAQEVAASLPHGLGLSRSLRCAACHHFPREDEVLPAPSLARVADNLRPRWLVQRLTAALPSDSTGSDTLAGMPHFAMHPNDAMAISAALFHASEQSPAPKDLVRELRRSIKKPAKDQPEERSQPNAQQGMQTFISKGCMACHRLGEMGADPDLPDSLFAGGDLSKVSVKRTRNFFFRWLADPAQVNRQHRMPIFDLTPLEQLDLIEFLSEQGSEASENDSLAAGDAQRGVGLISRYRCAACHELPEELAYLSTEWRDNSMIPIPANSDWQAGCLERPQPKAAIPGYGLDASQRQGLRTYLMSGASLPNAASGAQLLIENNCLACHPRDMEPGIARHFPQLLEEMPELAPRLAAMVPPSLSSVGDKLNDAAILAAVGRDEPVRREWLDIRMPKFRLDEGQKQLLVDYFVSRDRIPDLPDKTVELPNDMAGELAASRLVTAEGFGCQSCHQIADMPPPNVALNARGTNLSMLGQRIRPSWFLRWVHNPARIVPRMEMPAIQLPIQGVLDDSLELQLAALWKTLNTPGFRPPQPNPVRIVRNHRDTDIAETTHILADVTERGQQVYLRPLIFGLPNRNNFLFNLETGQLQTWWLGDTARQYTRGKSWYWEIGSEPLIAPPGFLEQVVLRDSANSEWKPNAMGQVAVELDRLEHEASRALWSGRLQFERATAPSQVAASRSLTIRQSYAASGESVSITTQIGDLQPGESLVIETSGQVGHSPAGLLIRFGLAGEARFSSSDAELSAEGEQRISARATGAAATSISWTSTYTASVAADYVPRVELALPKPTAQQVNCLPGYSGLRLPLPNHEMPISMTWSPSGEWFVGSLKGHVLQAVDSDADGLEDAYQVISDEIPTPYGLHYGAEGLDALAKFALVRLSKPQHAGQVWNAQVVADGWGYTNDYHDWAVGLPQDPQGNYYMALPCQQDDRSSAAATLRGHALKLIPNQSSQSGRAYRIESLAAGLRFPMGIALSQSGDLFTSDNQGNYNPFNELNHLRAGRRYGFINKLESQQEVGESFESPAVNLPHPWTRSVNGICFLNTPQALQQAGKKLFGPFEGQLVGCEMNNRALVRMSLQKVGDTYQGAAYPFSLPPMEGELGLEGPIICAISPAGDLMVGSLHDSGWGGGQNTGSIVRFRPDQELPCGVALVEAHASGFRIEFTSPVDAHKALDPKNYSIRSYQRIATPAYGGDDQDERTETIDKLALSADRMRIEVALDPLREGFVYEINLGAIGPSDAALLPAQAHYTMRSIPQ